MHIVYIYIVHIIDMYAHVGTYLLDGSPSIHCHVGDLQIFKTILWGCLALGEGIIHQYPSVSISHYSSL